MAFVIALEFIFKFDSVYLVTDCVDKSLRQSHLGLHFVILVESHQILLATVLDHDVAIEGLVLHTLEWQFEFPQERMHIGEVPI